MLKCGNLKKKRRIFTLFVICEVFYGEVLEVFYADVVLESVFDLSLQ